jgi:hypothetical protein
MSLYEEISRVTCGEVVKQSTLNCVRLLSTKYGFDPNEALAFLSVDAPPPKAKSKKHFTGYLLFSDSERPKIQKRLAAKLRFAPAHVRQGQKISPTVVVQNIAHRWRKLSRTEREEWNDRAAAGTPDAPLPDVVSSPVPSPVVSRAVSPVPYTNGRDLEEDWAAVLSEMGPGATFGAPPPEGFCFFTMV